MKLVDAQYRVILPCYEHYKLYQPLFDQDADETKTGFDSFANDHISRADVMANYAVRVTTYLLDLTLSSSHITNEDASKTYKHTRTKEFYEIRGISTHSHWGPATTTGKNREPKNSDNREKWEEHHKSVMSKPNSVSWYVICDISHPPFFHLTRIHSNSILYLYEKGTLKWNDPKQPNKYGLIKNKFSRNQFYKWFYEINKGSNPFEINGWQNCNPLNMSEESIKKNIDIFHKNTSNYSRKKEQKKMKNNGDSIVHFNASDTNTIKEHYLIKEFVNI